MAGLTTGLTDESRLASVFSKRQWPCSVPNAWCEIPLWFWGVREWARIWSALLSSRALTPWAPVAARFPLTSRSCTTRSTCCLTTSKGSSSSTVSTFTTPSAMSLISCRLSKSFSTHPTSANSYPCCAWSYPARTSCCSTSTHRKGFIWRRIC